MHRESSYHPSATHLSSSPLTSPETPFDESSTSDWRPGGARRRKQPDRKLSPFLQSQRRQLLELRDALLASMNGIARETRLEKADSSAFSNHNGDAGSDACDRDLVLCLLSQETDSLFEINEALKRIEAGTYGICELSNRPIPVARLRAIPFARFTVEFQEKIERQRKITAGPRSLANMATLFDRSDVDGMTAADWQAAIQ